MDAHQGYRNTGMDALSECVHTNTIVDASPVPLPVLHVSLQRHDHYALNIKSGHYHAQHTY